MLAKELNESLMVRAEPTDPMALIYAHQYLAANHQSVPKYVDK